LPVEIEKNVPHPAGTEGTRKERSMQSELLKMTKSIFSKVMWVGRATVFCVGLAVTLALMLGIAATALAANGDNFILGRTNVATAITRLTGAAGVNDPMLRIDNNNGGANATALDLRVEPGRPPMRVDSDAKVTDLNADELDGHDSAALPGSIASISTFSGFIPPLDVSSNDWVFAGRTTTVTTNTTQSLVGAAEAPLAVSSGGPQQLFAYGLCYQPSDGGTISHFFGDVSSRHSEGELTSTLMSWPAAASVVPGAGTWNVGFCVRALRVGLEEIDRTGNVNGWVQVVNRPPVAATSSSSVASDRGSR
jgi:hypothetical protein